LIYTAILLSAGYGSRLRPMTDSLPKCLMPVAGGVPLLGFWVNRLEAAGVERIFINTHYLADCVESYVEHLRPLVSVELVVTRETSLLGSLGTLRHIAANFEPAGALVMHCDNYTGFNLSQALAPPPGYPVSVVCFHSEVSDSVGRLEIDSSANQITGWMEKDPSAGPGWASNAIYSFDRVALDDIVGTQGADLISEWMIPNCIQSERFSANVVYNTCGNIDIGTIEALRAAQTPVCDTDYQSYFPQPDLGSWVESFSEVSCEVCP